MATTTETRVSIFTPNAQELLCSRYLYPFPNSPECPRCHKNHETEDQFLDRVSMGKKEYRELYEQGLFFANSPTLFNLGTGMGTLSACFKFDVEDSMEGIMDVARKAALVQKWGGGVGYYVGDIRPKGSPIKSTHKRACGPVAVLRHYNSVADLVTQGGKRAGAQMGILHCDHLDLREFIHMKDLDPQGLATFNISVAITDEWMEEQTRLRKDANFTILWEMAKSAWKTGDPGVYFIDAAERANPTPWLGELTGTNPCGEVPLLDNEACNLGSINLGKFILPSGVFEEGRLERTVRTTIRYLDEVLDANTFPDPSITTAVALTRKLGLGVMGWADMLALMHIPYDSQEAVDFGGKLMQRINGWTHAESTKLFQEKGIAPCFEREGNDIFRRNATLTSIAPTGTISILANCSSGIEPHYALSWDRRTGDGKILKEKIAVAHLLGDFIPKTANEIPWEWHVKHQAAFQEHTDLAVSKTINMPEDATIRDIYDAYIEMWRSGCKGGTVFRNNCRGEQVLTDHAETKELLPALEALQEKWVGTERLMGDNIKAQEIPRFIPHQENGRRRLPETRKSITHKFTVGDQEGYVHVGLFEDGTPGEIFLNISKQGSTVSGIADLFAVALSIGLQHGVPLTTFIRKMRQSRFEPSGFTQNKEIRTATSIMDYLAQWLESEFPTIDKEPRPHYEGHFKGNTLLKGGNAFLKGGSNGDLQQETGMTCPDCGNGVIAQEGCLKCLSCNWTRC